MIRFFTIIILSCVACLGQVKQWHLTNTIANVQLQLDNRVMRVATLAALKALPAVQVASGALVSTAGYTTAGDGGGGLYRYDASSTATANDGSVILPTHGTGRYLLQHSGEVNLRQFGARGDTSIGWIRNVTGAPTPTDDAPALQTAINFCGENGAKLFVPNGRYFIGTTVSNRSYTGVAIEGVTESLALTGQYTSNIVAQQTTFIRNGNYTMLLFAGALTAAEMTNNSYLFGLQRYAKVSNLLIQDANRGAAVTEPCVAMKRSMLSRWHNVEFSGIQSSALDLWTADDAIFTNCRWLACGVQQRSAVVIHRRETSGSEPEYEINNTLTFNSCNWEGAYWTQIEVPATGVGDAATVKFIGCTIKNADFAGSSIAPMISLTRANNFYFDNLEVVHDGTAITSPVTLNNIVFFDRCRLYGKLILNQLGHSTNVTIVNAARILDPRDSDLAIDVGSTAAATISGSEIISVSNTTANTSFNLSGRSFRNDGTIGGAYNNKPYSNWIPRDYATVPFISDLFKQPLREGLVVQAMNYATAGDGGGGRYMWTSTIGTTNAFGGRISNGTGAWVLQDNPMSFLQWGVVAGSTSAASNNAVRMQAALVALKDGGHITLPRLTQTVFVGPNPVRPAQHMTNVTIELHGQIHVPDSPIWYHASNPSSLFHFADSGSYNNIRITGSAVINGNATNQTVATTNNYNFGKMNCFRVDYGTNVFIDGLTIRNFGFFGVLVSYGSDVKIRNLSIFQTGGNNDTLPTRYGANCDGIHVYNSKDVTVSGCHIESTDDCIAFTQSDAAGVISTNYIVTGNVLRPRSAAPGFVPSAFRLGLEPGISNGAIRDVLFANNIIKPVAANGAYIGSAITGQPRSISRIRILGNLFQDVQSSDVIVAGPNAGSTNTASILTGGITALNADDVEVSENLFQNVRSHAIMAGNVGRMRIFGNTITNIIDNTGGTEARGVGVYVSHGLYGDVDELIVENNEFSGLDGGCIVGSNGSTFEIKTLRVRGNTFERWLRGLYASSGRAHPAILASRSRTNFITDNVFRGGEGSAVVIGSAFATMNDISRNTFAYFTQTTGSGVGGVEWIRVTNPGGAVAGRTYIKGNRFGSTPSRFANLINVANIYITDNDFTPHEMIASNPTAESIFVDYASGTSGNATLAIKGNFVHIENKLGANPQQLVRTYNNTGSGGSTVALTTLLDGNLFTPQSGMVPLIDAFAGGAREIAYASTLTITNYTVNPLRLRVALGGNMTLAWSNPFPGQRGTLDVYPDTVARVITLPSLAYSPTGSTITNSGGTGSTNWTRLNWEVHQVGGTNRIFVQPTDVYR